MPITRPDAGRSPGRRPLWGLVATLAVAASLGVAACGGDDDDDGDVAATTTETTGVTGAAAGAGETVDVTMTDFEFDPKDPTVKPGEVTFDVVNDGETLHNMEVEGPSGAAELPEDLQPGDSGSFSVDLGEPGKYRFYCPVGNHEDLGMVGEVTVKG
ncbi:MAG TPA: cupredoxin domain-containing protein [Solirubrobacterales bacterium]|nr:cupredoxin domain-containing protein [Solirubrobacterales bacterium]